jgi:hypothetical protein
MNPTPDMPHSSAFVPPPQVHGWSNTSFTITATVESLFVIPLAEGRPQFGFVGTEELVYYSATLGNSAEDLHIMVTTLTGRAELYVSDNLDMHNLPDPAQSTSYQFTTHNKGGSELLIPGPHLNTNRTTFVIGVYGAEETEFSVTARYSQSAVMLQEGVPVQQAVSAGRTEHFIYKISSYADIVITVTAIQGDPDVMASTVHERPVCVQPEDDPAAWTYECYNYTWISQSFASDQIVIQHDLPCDGSGHTRVADDCDPSTLTIGSPLHIGVYGYDDTVFTIAVSTGGGHTNLVPGKPQHGVTRPGGICGRRSEAGTCDSEDETLKHVQVAYFRFRVSPDDLDKDTNPHVSFAIEPSCNKTVTPCQPGCPCNPVTVYIKSCVETECSMDDMYPSALAGRNDVTHLVDAGHSTAFIAHDPLNPNNGFCDPQQHGQTCLYYVAVQHQDLKRPASFSISASTPRDVLVLPTHSNPAPPDGVTTSSLDAVTGQQKNYQMYADRDSSMQITLEACTGDLSLAVCDGTCSALYPSEKDYRFYVDSSKSCTKSGRQSAQCVQSATGLPRIALPKARDDTYFLGVRGSGTYYLKVDMAVDGQSVTPLLAAPESRDVPKMEKVGSDRVTLSWEHARLSVPGRSSGSVVPQYTRYRVYALDETALKDAPPAAAATVKPVLTTPCGLEHYAAMSEDGSSRVALVDEGQTRVTVQGLKPGTQYRFVVAATCDSDCLQHTTKVTSQSTLPLSCGGPSPCQDQWTLYSAAYVVTSMSTGEGDHHGGGPNGISTTVTLLVLILVVAVGAAALLYRKNRRLEQQLQYEMTDTSNFTTPIVSRKAPTTFSVRPGAVGNKKAYEPLLTVRGEGVFMVLCASHGVIFVLWCHRTMSTILITIWRREKEK